EDGIRDFHVTGVQTCALPISPMNANIYHNPACGTSRNTLALIRHAGIEPTVIEYLRQPPSRERLIELIAAAGLGTREALRQKGTPDRKSTRLNSSHVKISYAVFCLKKKKTWGMIMLWM